MHRTLVESSASSAKISFLPVKPVPDMTCVWWDVKLSIYLSIYLTPPVVYSLKVQDAQLSQRDCAAGCVIVFAKSKRLHGRQYFTDIIGLYSTTVI